MPASVVNRAACRRGLSRHGGEVGAGQGAEQAALQAFDGAIDHVLRRHRLAIGGDGLGAGHGDDDRRQQPGDARIALGESVERLLDDDGIQRRAGGDAERAQRGQDQPARMLAQMLHPETADEGEGGGVQGGAGHAPAVNRGGPRREGVASSGAFG